MRRAFFRNQDGVAALEFGLLAPVFFMLLLVLIDLSFFFAVHSIIDDAVESGARAVRLGTLKSDKDGTKFREALCARLFLVECNDISFSVDTATDLSKVNPKPAIGTDGKLIAPKFNVGGHDAVVVITIVYVHKFIIPYVGDIFGDDGLDDPSGRAILSFLVIKNEPFPD